MLAADHKEINPAINSETVEANSETAQAMAKYGITRVPVDYFQGISVHQS